MKKYMTIKVDEELNTRIKAMLIGDLIVILNRRNSMVMLGVKAFKTAKSEGKSLEDCLVEALDLTASDDDSWSIGLDTFYGSRENGRSVQESLEQALKFSLVKTTSETTDNEKKSQNIETKAKSFLNDSWQSIKKTFGPMPAVNKDEDYDEDEDEELELTEDLEEPENHATEGGE